MVFIQEQEMVKTLLTDRARPPFIESVGIRCDKRCVNDVHAFGLENGIKCLCELAVSVVNQETGVFLLSSSSQITCLAC